MIHKTFHEFLIFLEFKFSFAYDYFNFMFLFIFLISQIIALYNYSQKFANVQLMFLLWTSLGNKSFGILDFISMCLLLLAYCVLTVHSGVINFYRQFTM